MVTESNNNQYGLLLPRKLNWVYIRHSYMQELIVLASM